MDDLVDFSECKFIEQRMRFYTYQEFKENSTIINYLYNKLSKNGKLFFKWYVYANSHMSYKAKARIWDYLNGYCRKEDL